MLVWLRRALSKEVLLLSSGRASSRLSWRAKYTDSSGYTHFRSRGSALQVPQFDGKGGGGLPTSPLVLGGALAAFFTGIYLNNLETIPYTNRRHLVLISPENERALGTKMYKDLLAETKRAGKLLPKDHKLTRLVSTIGKRIAKEAENLGDWEGNGQKVDHMKKLQWEFNVINSDEANAFVLPGGKVIVYSGLFRVLKGKEELAMVLAHEIAHTVARHNAEKITQEMTTTVLRVMVTLALGADIVSTPLLLGLKLPYSRKCENEADAIGLQLLARSCFDPRHGPKAMSRLSGGAGAAAMPEYLSTHPHSATRVANLKKELPGASEVYEARCLMGGTFRDQMKFFF